MTYKDAVRVLEEKGGDAAAQWLKDYTSVHGDKKGWDSAFAHTSGFTDAVNLLWPNGYGNTGWTAWNNVTHQAQRATISGQACSVYKRIGIPESWGWSILKSDGSVEEFGVEDTEEQAKAAVVAKVQETP